MVVAPRPAAQAGLTIPIVRGALLRIAQHVVRLGDGLELLLRFLGAPVAVGVVRHRELAICLLDVVVGGGALDTEDCVEIGHGGNIEGSSTIVLSAGPALSEAEGKDPHLGQPPQYAGIPVPGTEIGIQAPGMRGRVWRVGRRQLASVHSWGPYASPSTWYWYTRVLQWLSPPTRVLQWLSQVRVLRCAQDDRIHGVSAPRASTPLPAHGTGSPWPCSAPIVIETPGR